VQKLKVADLQSLCLGAIQDLISERCFRIASIVTDNNPSSSKGTMESVMDVFCPAERASLDRQEFAVNTFITEFKEYIWSRVVWYLYDKVVYCVLEGVIKAIEVMKARWTIDTNMPDFRMKVCAMLKVGEVMHLKQLQSLNVDAMPKMIRPSVIRNLSDFCQLKRLNLGSSSGGKKGQMLNTCVLEGIEKMSHLVHFSLKYNCRNDILETLAEACIKTLRILDIEHSNQVTDESVSNIIKLKNIVELGISRTNLTAEGQSKIIIELEYLQVLPRGDYLCDASEWIDWEVEKSQKRKLKITNFWASEVYYFHSRGQMEHVADLCPLIEDMHFMFEDSFTCELDVLQQFKSLKNLELFGGDFTLDGFCHTLDNIGPNLIKLDLHHVDSIDLRAVAMLSLSCQGLRYLGFSGCIFNHPDIEMLENNPENHLYIIQQQRIEQELKSNLVPFLDLETISIASQCPEKLLVVILSLCINVKKINLGMNCGIGDSTFDQILSNNKFQYLEEIDIKKNDELTMKTLSSLLLYCDNLRSILDVDEWSKVNKSDLAELKYHMKESNIDLILQETPEDMRGVSLYQICQTALKEKYKRSEWFDDA